MPLTIGTAHVALSFDEDTGRIVALIDRATERNWLVPPSGRADGSADRYGVNEACGWDECFPSVDGIEDGSALGWPGPIRDHGVLWGRQADLIGGHESVVATWTGPTFRFSRTATLSGRRVAVRYSIENIGAAPFGYLYSQHMLLALLPGETIDLAGIGALGEGQGAPGTRWPIADLIDVPPAPNGLARKLYGPLEGRVVARLGGREGTIEISWEDSDLPVCGLWVSHGGWPDPLRGVEQVAIEPTTALTGALGPSSARWLSPGETHDFAMTIALSS